MRRILRSEWHALFHERRQGCRADSEAVILAKRTSSRRWLRSWLVSIFGPSDGTHQSIRPWIALMRTVRVHAIGRAMLAWVPSMVLNAT